MKGPTKWLHVIILRDSERRSQSLMSAQGNRLGAEVLEAGGSSQLESADATSRFVTGQLVT